MFTFNIDYSSKEAAQTSVQTAVQDWNTYVANAKTTDLQPILDQMAAAKSAYFTALAQLSPKLKELSEDERKMSDLQREHRVGGALLSFVVAPQAHPQAFITGKDLR
jgi:hypothetical protein